MKSYKEMADNVLKRSDAIIKKKTKKIRIMRRITSVLSCFLFVTVLGAYALNSVFNRVHFEEPDMSNSQQTESNGTQSNHNSPENSDDDGTLISSNDSNILWAEGISSDNSDSRPQGSQNPDVEHPESVDELDYTFLETNGKWYLVFDDISVYSSGGKSEVSTLSFDTIKEMKVAIKTGKLKEWQKRVVATSFSKDQVGVKVPNLEKLYVPKIPVDGVVDSVIWSGESYSFSVTLDKNIFGMLHVYTAEQYANIFASDYESYFEKDTISVSSTETLDGGKSVTYYFTNVAQLMQVRYVLTEGNKTFTIDKTYRYNEENADAEGNYSLANITMYCEDGDEKYVVDLFGFIEEPTDTWLLAFDLSEYNEKEVAMS